MDPGFEGPEACIIFGTIFNKKNTNAKYKVSPNMNIDLEREEKSQQILKFKNLSNDKGSIKIIIVFFIA